MFTDLRINQMHYDYQAQVTKKSRCAVRKVNISMILPEPIASKSNGVITTPGLNATEGNLNDVGNWITLDYKEST